MCPTIVQNIAHVRVVASSVPPRNAVKMPYVTLRTGFLLATAMTASREMDRTVLQVSMHCYK